MKSQKKRSVKNKKAYSRPIYVYLAPIAPGVLKLGKTINSKGRFPNSLVFRELDKPTDCISLEAAAKRSLQRFQLSKAAANEYGSQYGTTELFGCSWEAAIEILLPLFNQYAIAVV